MATLLLNTAYFPPVHYISRINNAVAIIIEQFENYGKQSYRNRCEIMTANGVMALSVPIKKPSTIKFLTKEAEVDYSVNWQKLHFKAIESAYKNSPYYDYYIDDFIVFFQKKEKFLLELNTKILHTLLNVSGINKIAGLSEDYIADNKGYHDLRYVIHPKVSKRAPEAEIFTAKPYYQTFGERFPFVPNLSILDLLFNTGQEVKNYL